MPGYNLQTYRDRLRFLLQTVYSGASDQGLFSSDALLFHLLNEAFLRIGRELGAHWARATATLTSGTGSYALPEDRQGQSIRSVYVKNAAGTEETELDGWAFQEFQRRFDVDDLDGTRGTPSAWSIDPSDQSKILVRDIPDYTLAGGLIFQYDAVTALHRILNSSSLTATLANASASVTVSGTISAGQVEAGDEFGIVRTTQTDGTALEGEIESPVVWYRLSAAASGSSPTWTLASVSVEPSYSAKNFVAAQVHPIEKAFPGVMGFAPCDLARAIYHKSRNFGEGATMEDGIAGRIGALLKPRTPNLRMPRSRPREYWPA